MGRRLRCWVKSRAALLPGCLLPFWVEVSLEGLCVLGYKQWEEVLAGAHQEVISLPSASSVCVIRCQPQSPSLCHSKKPDAPVLVYARGCVNVSPGRAPGGGGGEAIGTSPHREEPGLQGNRCGAACVGTFCCFSLNLPLRFPHGQEVPSALGEVDFGVYLLFVLKQGLLSLFLGSGFHSWGLVHAGQVLL